MSKTMPAESGNYDRADWEKDDYVVALIAEKCKKAPNKFYQTAEDLTEKYGPQVAGERYWLDKKGEKVYADAPEDAEQWNLVFEVQEGEKKGDWLFVFASPRFYKKKDGSWGGKLAAIYLAAKPGFDLSQGIEDDLSDIDGVPLRATVEPQQNPQYGKATGWMPVKKGWRPAAAPVVVDGGSDDSIPF